MSGRVIKTPSSGSAKKQFKPNLNAAGKKEVKKEPVSPVKSDAATSKKRGRSFERPKHEKKFVQSAGVFSEGFADRQGPRFGRPSHSRTATDGNDKLSKYKRLKVEDDEDGSRAKNEMVEEETNEEQLMEELFASSSNFIADLKGGKFEPRDLVDISEMYKSVKSSEPKRQNYRILDSPEPGTEPADESQLRLMLNGLQDNTDDQRLMFFQLPNVLSHMLVENVRKKAELERLRKAEQTQVCVDDDPTISQVTEETNRPEPSHHCLDDLPDGQIGKLQILKSGKSRLVIGDTVVKIEPATDVSCYQEVVSINANDKKGEICVLGQIGLRFVCTQDIESLVRSYRNS